MRPIRTLSQWIYVSAAIYALLILTDLLFALWSLPKFHRIVTTARQHGLSDEIGSQLDTLAALENVGTLLPIISLISFIVCAVLIGIWTNRSHHNAHSLNIEGLTVSPAWAVGSYFVPIANLFLPYRAMKQLWLGSLNAAEAKPVSAVLPAVWWTLWLGGVIVSRIFDRMSDYIEKSADTAVSAEQFIALMESAQYSLALGCIAGAMLLGCTFCLLKIIRRINRAHEQINAQTA